LSEGTGECYDEPQSRQQASPPRLEPPPPQIDVYSIIVRQTFSVKFRGEYMDQESELRGRERRLHNKYCTDQRKETKIGEVCNVHWRDDEYVQYCSLDTMGNDLEDISADRREILEVYLRGIRMHGDERVSSRTGEIYFPV
jgi:hypothetical protein